MNRQKTSDRTPHSGHRMLVEMSNANNNFGTNLFREIAKKKKGENVFLSPFSISLALAMTQLGGRGDMADRMSELLKWRLTEGTEIHSAYREYLDSLESTSGKNKLEIANRIYVDKRYPILQEFVSKTKQYYKSEPISAGFSTNSDAEREAINTWVSGLTHGKIPEVISRGQLDESVRMLLVNAIYFKGEWQSLFDPKDTEVQPFKISPAQNKDVPMMKASKRYGVKHYPVLKCRALELPYNGRNLGMVVILPDEEFGLRALLGKWCGKVLHYILSDFPKPEHVIDLTLPKFEISSSFSLNEMLSKLGISDSFSDAANFEGITGTRDLRLSGMAHTAIIKVDEYGTEAAGAAPVWTCSVDDELPGPFVADRPFLFVIRDKTVANLVLFMGAVWDPTVS